MKALIPRSAAYFVDFLVALGFLEITQQLLFTPLGEALGVSENWFRSGINTQLFTLVTVSIPVWLYFSLMDASKWQATLGKLLLKLEVVRTPEKTRINFPRSFLRTLVKVLPWEIALLTNNLPEPLWVATDPGFRIGFALVGVLFVLYIGTVVIRPDGDSK